MQNTPWKVIDPATGLEKTIWQSRSMASAIFVFTKDNEGNWRVLANKRGPGCPDFIGHWVCPCGYLDYGETLKAAAWRECYEETGVRLDYNSIKEYKLNDDPMQNLENVTKIHYIVVKNGLDYTFSKKNNEENEVDSIAWIRLDLINNFNWAFNHKEIMMEVFNMRVNLPWWKRKLLALYEKYLNPESYKMSEYADNTVNGTLIRHLL